MNYKLIIVGSGSLLNVCAEIAILNKIKIKGYVDNIKTKNSNIFSIKYLGNLKNIEKYIDRSTKIILAIGDNYQRFKTYSSISKINKNTNFATLIHPNTYISNHAKINIGSIICCDVNVNINTYIGKFCILNSKTSIDHDNYISDFVGTGPGAKTGGQVKINNFSFIGINSSIKNNIKVDTNTVVGGNSFLNKNSKKNSTYIGVPAKIKKKRRIGEKYL